MMKTKKKIFLIDIDGCILSSCFPNLTEPRNREKVIQEVLEFSKKISLFPAFIKYYENFIKNHFSIFITGRQKSEFKELTEKQLEPLKKISPYLNIFYYPENRSHNPKKYFSWKTNVIKMYINDERTKYLIFDDLDNYFEDLKLYFWNLKHLRDFNYNYDISYFKVNSNDGWNDLI